MPDLRAGLRLYVCACVCTTERFGYFAVVVMFCSLCGLYFCQLVSLLVPSPQISVSIFPAALFVIVAFAGFVVRLPYLPDFLSSWAPTLSFARWAFQGLVINEFQGNGKINYASIVTKDKLEKIMRIPNAKLNPYEVCSTHARCMAWSGLSLRCTLLSTDLHRGVRIPELRQVGLHPQPGDQRGCALGALLLPCKIRELREEVGGASRR